MQLKRVLRQLVEVEKTGDQMAFQMLHLVAVEHLLVGGLLENQKEVDLGEKRQVALGLLREQMTYVMEVQKAEKAWEQMNRAHSMVDQ